MVVGSGKKLKGDDDKVILNKIRKIDSKKKSKKKRKNNKTKKVKRKKSKRKSQKIKRKKSGGTKSPSEPEPEPEPEPTRGIVLNMSEIGAEDLSPSKEEALRRAKIVSEPYYEPTEIDFKYVQEKKNRMEESNVPLEDIREWEKEFWKDESKKDVLTGVKLENLRKKEEVERLATKIEEGTKNLEVNLDELPYIQGRTTVAGIKDPELLIKDLDCKSIGAMCMSTRGMAKKCKEGEEFHDRYILPCKTDIIIKRFMNYKYDWDNQYDGEHYWPTYDYMINSEINFYYNVMELDIVEYLSRYLSYGPNYKRLLGEGEVALNDTLVYFCPGSVGDWRHGDTSKSWFISKCKTTTVPWTGPTQAPEIYQKIIDSLKDPITGNIYPENTVPEDEREARDRDEEFVRRFFSNPRWEGGGAWAWMWEEEHFLYTMRKYIGHRTALDWLQEEIKIRTEKIESSKSTNTKKKHNRITLDDKIFLREADKTLKELSLYTEGSLTWWVTIINTGVLNCAGFCHENPIYPYERKCQIFSTCIPKEWRTAALSGRISREPEHMGAFKLLMNMEDDILQLFRNIEEQQTSSRKIFRDNQRSASYKYVRTDSYREQTTKVKDVYRLLKSRKDRPFPNINKDEYYRRLSELKDVFIEEMGQTFNDDIKAIKYFDEFIQLLDFDSNEEEMINDLVMEIEDDLRDLVKERISSDIK